MFYSWIEAKLKYTRFNILILNLQLLEHVYLPSRSIKMTLENDVSQIFISQGFLIRSMQYLNIVG